MTLQTWNLSQIKQSQNSYSRNWSRLFTPYDDLGQVMSFLFFTLEIIRTLLQPRRSFVLVGWSFLEGTSHFLVVCADRLTTLVLEKKARQERTARRSPNHRSHYSFAATAWEGSTAHMYVRYYALCYVVLLRSCFFSSCTLL